MPDKLCKVCQSPICREYIFREMMFGTRDKFLYYECSGCGSLQIAEMPANITDYYPPYYYSFNSEVPVLKRDSSKGFFQRFFIDKKERKSRKQAISYLAPTHIQPHHRILDIGCGKGELICRLFNLGYESVEGTDKYLPEEIEYGFNVKVMKKDLQEIESNTYDLLMMHHVFEHMFFPEQELRECFRILKNNSYLIVRIPVKGYAWEKYREDWVQLDAPRHFFIHTTGSMNILAKKTGFILSNTIFDSSNFQFIGSELYKRDIPLAEVNTGVYNVKQIFSSKERRIFRKKARELNKNEVGDQAIFYLYKE